MIATARQAAREAGTILKQHYGTVPPAAIRHKAATDFISYVDELSEAAIVETIHSRFSGHGILGEESGATLKKSPYRWIIDPLDGTTNYLHQVPVFAVSIALEFEQELVLGVIYDPLRDELFEAQKDQGALLNDEPISVSSKPDLSQSLIATGFPFKCKQFLPSYLQAFEAIFNRSIGKRRLGAAAIDLAYLAAGRFDGFWEIGLQPWDIAAGAVLIREAGGKITDFWDGSDFLEKHYLLATNGHIHGEMLPILKQHFPQPQPVYSN